MLLTSIRAAIAIAALFIATTAAADGPRKVVLIGGTKSEGPGRHDYPNGIRTLERLLRTSPDFQAVRALDIESHPDGWPDERTFDAASTVVWYFDGLDKHPLLESQRHAHFRTLMSRGAGLVVLHQATTVPSRDRDFDLPRWLGGARDGMFDRATEMAQITPATPSHPVSRGLAAFTYLEEFYPTVRWQDAGNPPTPILKARLHVEFRDGKDLVIGDPIMSTVAWVYERPDGGRAFGFTGAHYLASLEQPMVRTMLLNAIAWTAHIEVPAGGIRSP